MISTKIFDEIELHGKEKMSFLTFLAAKCEKTVNLERILGIGGEGIVLAQKMDTRENHYKKGWDEKKGRNVALKFVKFKRNGDEDFLGAEKEDSNGMYGGINEKGKCVESQYLNRLYKLGDFSAATHFQGGYCRPYIDFGISAIHRRYYYVIGQFINFPHS